MKRLAVLAFCLATLLPAAAQEATTPITPENAADLRPVSIVGSALPGALAFSPDSRYLIAGTTDDLLVYRADALDAPPQRFDAQPYTFDADGFFVADGRRWNLGTGLSVGVAPSLTVRQADGERAAIIEIVKPGGETINVETGIAQHIRHTVVSDDYSILAVATEDDYRRLLRPTVYLFRLPEGRQIAALPQAGDGEYVARLFFTHWGDSDILAVETLTGSHMNHGALGLYRADTGEPLNEHSGRIPMPIVRDGEAFAALLANDTIVYGTGSEIDSFPYPPQRAGDPLLFVSRYGLAVVNQADEMLRMLPFGLDAEAGAPVVGRYDGAMRNFPTFYGSTLVYGTGGSDGTIFAWDMAALDDGPRALLTNQRLGSRRFSPDFTRYLAPLADSMPEYEVAPLGLFDTATGEMLLELPRNAVLVPDWSQAVFWRGGEVVAIDLATGAETTVDPLPRYLGRVADFVPGVAAFIGETVQVVDLEPGYGGMIGAIEPETLPRAALLFNGGLCVVTFEYPERGGLPDLTIHELNTESPCDPASHPSGMDPDHAVVTPSGTFIVDYSTYCFSPYTYPSANVYPLRRQPAGELANILHIMSACGRDAFAMAPDESAVYYADGMLRRTAFETEDGGVVRAGTTETLLSYFDPIDYSEAYVRSVYLSPDGDRVAVMVEETNGSDFVLARYVEVFDLRGLVDGRVRRDMRALRTIPDATIAAFSPDGRYVVTDIGLYAIEFENVTPAVDGTIGAFSPDSQLLATYQDGFVTLWGVARPGSQNFPLAQYEVGGVRELAFSDDGTRLYVVRDGEVQTWGIPGLG